MNFKKSISYVAVMVILCMSFSVNAEITIDPIGAAVSMEATDSTGVELTMTNDGDTDVNFEIGFRSPPDEKRRGTGPRRDDLEDDDIRSLTADDGVVDHCLVDV
jgi:hypothetical protein